MALRSSGDVPDDQKLVNQISDEMNLPRFEGTFAERESTADCCVTAATNLSVSFLLPALHVFRLQPSSFAAAAACSTTQLPCQRMLSSVVVVIVVNPKIVQFGYVALFSAALPIGANRTPKSLMHFGVFPLVPSSNERVCALHSCGGGSNHKPGRAAFGREKGEVMQHKNGRGFCSPRCHRTWH